MGIATELGVHRRRRRRCSLCRPSDRYYESRPILKEDDGFLSVRGCELDERRIHQATVHVAGLALQADLQGTPAVPVPLRCHFGGLSLCSHETAQKVTLIYLFIWQFINYTHLSIDLSILVFLEI